ncbi:MAG: heme lyase CcmF/NrfE family subunit [Pseudomonadota bacterium]
MMIELGHYCLVLALALALMQSVFPLWGARANDKTLMGMAPWLSMGQAALVTAAFSILIHAYVVSDFSVATVVANSHSAKPLLYRITGAWGNHEGSMLLWLLVLTLFSAAFGSVKQDMPQALRATALAVQAWISSTFLLFILLTSNPFARLPYPPMEGRDLNPLLQDIGLALHPPLLYLGYVGFSVCFALAIAALFFGRADQQWARIIRPWCLAAWVFLTLGVAMGSYWAYYELGWGGFWFWDPVENASFMPWLAGTMLLHSALVMEKRGALPRWTVLMAICAFSLSLIGTFLVRSGILTSVHTFATDPSRGIAILIILCVFIGGGLLLYALRAINLKTDDDYAAVSRETSLVLNNILLTAALTAVFTGTLYPLLLEALTGDKISVGPPYFNLTFGAAMMPLLLLLPLGPLLAWKNADIMKSLRRLRLALLLGVAAAVFVFWQTQGAWLAASGIAIAIYVMAGAVAELLQRVQLFQAPLQESWQRLKGLKFSNYGTFFGHFGMGVFTLGIVCATAFADETSVTLQKGQSVSIASYDLNYEALKTGTGPNYSEQIAQFSVRRGGAEIGKLESAKRFYPVRNFPTTEAGLFTCGFSQLYLSLAEIRNESVTVRLYYKPLVLLIWIGCAVIALGGFLSMLTRFGRARTAI